MNDPQNAWAWKPTALDPESAEFSQDVAARFTAQLDQENQYSPSMNTVPVPHEPVDIDDPVGFLIDRVTNVVPEAAQMGTEPLTTIASVLAQLYQAQSLRGMEGLLFGIDQKLERILPATAHPGRADPLTDRNRPLSTPSEVNWQAEARRLAGALDTWQAQARRLSEELDTIACAISDALKPELPREEIVMILKDLDTERFIRHR